MLFKWYKHWEEEVRAEAAMLWKAAWRDQGLARTALQTGAQLIQRAWLGKRAGVREVIN